MIAPWKPTSSSAPGDRTALLAAKEAVAAPAARPSVLPWTGAQPSEVLRLARRQESGVAARSTTQSCATPDSWRRANSLWIAQPPNGGPLSRGFDPDGYPTKPLVSYQINRQLSGWNLPPLVLRAFGAHYC
jgi:hypothetical protein